MGKLSDIQLKTWIKASNPIICKSDGGGLTFTLSRAGVAAWVLRYRHGGKQSEYSIGRYPDISLAEARALAAELRRRVQQGEDIAASKQDEKAKAAAEKAKALITANTTSALAAEWLARAISASHRQRSAALPKTAVCLRPQAAHRYAQSGGRLRYVGCRRQRACPNSRPQRRRDREI